jgi:SiaC family regulatory phosphoprotein
LYKQLKMQKLHISPTSFTPEILFSPEENVFIVRGKSSPANVETAYAPVIEWFKAFVDESLEKSEIKYTPENPFVFQFDFLYFNSSTSLFVLEIFSELKRLLTKDMPVVVKWFHDEEDIDMKDAGFDISSLAGIELTYIQK